MQILRMEFQKFRILEVLNFYPCLCELTSFINQLKWFITLKCTIVVILK